jgi:hypothetical protein
MLLLTALRISKTCEGLMKIQSNFLEFLSNFAGMLFIGFSRPFLPHLQAKGPPFFQGGKIGLIHFPKEVIL